MQINSRPPATVPTTALFRISLLHTHPIHRKKEEITSKHIGIVDWSTLKKTLVDQNKREAADSS